MNVVHSFTELASRVNRMCVAIGVFDGAHLGHRSVIHAALDDAKAVGGTAVVLTFDPHPLRVLMPAKAPPLLTSTPHKLALMESLGVSVCLVLPFTQQFARTEPGAFLEQLFRSAKNLRAICVGHAFRFGHERKGNVQTILAFGKEKKVRVDILPPVTAQGETISSTAVRKAVLAGDLTKAGLMLGRPFSVLGTVEAGDRIGRKLGYPTANLNPNNEILPPNGVYAVLADHDGTPLKGIVNIGVRPTIATHPTERRLELHILDFSGDLYGTRIEVRFLQKLRDERKFESAESLKAQIACDEDVARRILSA